MHSKFRVNFSGIIQAIFFLMGIIPALMFAMSSDAESSQMSSMVMPMILTLFIGCIVNWISMLIHSIKQSRVGWVLVIVFLAPFSSWLYFLFIYLRASGNYMSAIEMRCSTGG